MSVNYKCLVLMSTYNGEKYIEKQIDSILHQEKIEISLLIRDDGSKDKTIEILKGYELKYPEKVRIIEGENKGIHKSFAELMDVAEVHDFIAFADQDDVWDSDKLVIAVSKLVGEKADFYSSASRLVDDSLNDLGKTTANIRHNNHYMMTKSAVLTPGTQGCTIVLSKKFFELLRNKGIPDYYGHDTWLTVVAYYLVKCIYDESAHMAYRQHDNSWTGNRKHRFMQLVREFRLLIKGMSRYRMLAQDIVEKYGDCLEKNDKKVLDILALNHRSAKQKSELIFDMQFGKYGVVRNIIFKFFILVGKA